MVKLKEEFFSKEYWSKSEAFLLPLTGLPSSLKYKLQSYLFWEKYSIEDYYFILKFSYGNYDEFLEYLNKTVFPILDKAGYVVETYDFDKESIIILNFSDWSSDIENFLKGSYSRLSREAKDLITDYHLYYDRGNKIKLHIQTALEPHEKHDYLGKMSGLEYASEYYGLPELMELGELGGIYDKEKETLDEKDYLRPEGNSLE